MIRRRIASVDDAVIFRLVADELVPFSRVSNPNISYSLKSIQQRLKRATTFVAAKGNAAPYGFVSTICKKRILFIDMLAVDSRSQGRGWGKALMDTAEKYGISKGCVASQLFVDEVNTKAIGFYQRKGYRPVQYIPQIKCYLMDKPLS
jgi:ribosomal protein S18 acetylase RimI-like enzyme